MQDMTMLKTFKFIETIKQRFQNENITALNIRRSGIKLDNEYLKLWLNQNYEEYELIGHEIRRTTTDERIESAYNHIIRMKNERLDNVKSITFLNIRNNQIDEQINKLVKLKDKLMENKK